MIIIQMTGLSGSGKSTIAELVAKRLDAEGIEVEVIDGDVFRKSPINRELGFSIQDRKKNLERLFYIANLLSKHKIVVIISAINPIDELRKEFAAANKNVKTVLIHCAWETLLKRDIKGLYKRALLADDNSDKLQNFTGISSPYELPANPDLSIDTDKQDAYHSAEILYKFIIKQLAF